MLMLSFGWASAMQVLALVVLLSLPAAFILRGAPAQARGRGAAQAERRRGHPAGAAQPELPAARGRLLRLRLPCRLPGHAPAGGDRGLRAAAAVRRLVAGLAGPVQHRRQPGHGLGHGPLALAARCWRCCMRRARLAVLLFLLAPKTGPVVLIFAAVMGLTFLSTVPPTAGLVAKFFGPANMAHAVRHRHAVAPGRRLRSACGSAARSSKPPAATTGSGTSTSCWRWPRR